MAHSYRTCTPVAVHRATFRSTFDSLREQTKAANDLLVRNNPAHLPKPDGPLSVPILGARRQGVFPFSTASGDGAQTGLPANSYIVNDLVNGK